MTSGSSVPVGCPCWGFVACKISVVCGANVASVVLSACVAAGVLGTCLVSVIPGV